MTHPKLWGTTDTRNGLPTTTKESPDFSHGECQQALYEMLQLRNCTRTEAEYRLVAREMTKLLKAAVPEIFDDLGCRGDELGYCPERFGSCGKYPLKGEM